MSLVLYNGLINQLKCELCKEYLFKPVRKCANEAHAFCPNCFEILDYCSECDSEMSSRRYKYIEKLISTQYFPCKYHTEGCSFIGKGYIIKKHEENCEMTIRQCPLLYYHECNWKGLTKRLTDHCRLYHPLNFYESNKKTLRCAKFKRDNCRGCIYYVVFAAYNELFRLTWYVNYVTGLVRWQVFFIGVKKKSNRFSFEIIFDKILAGGKVVIRAPCQNFTGSLEDFELNKSVIISYNMLKEYCFDDDLCYTISIIDNKATPVACD